MKFRLGALSARIYFSEAKIQWANTLARVKQRKETLEIRAG